MHVKQLHMHIISPAAYAITSCAANETGFQKHALGIANILQNICIALPTIRKCVQAFRFGVPIFKVHIGKIHDTSLARIGSKSVALTPSVSRDPAALDAGRETAQLPNVEGRRHDGDLANPRNIIDMSEHCYADCWSTGKLPRKNVFAKSSIARELDVGLWTVRVFRAVWMFVLAVRTVRCVYSLWTIKVRLCPGAAVRSQDEWRHEDLERWTLTERSPV